MRESTFRRIALNMEGAVESEHMGHPDFRVNHRIFATLHHDRKTGMVGLTPEQQAEFVRISPDVFQPESGAWGRAGSTRVRLATGTEEIVGEAITLAWQNAINKASSKLKTRPKPKTRSKSTRER